MVSDDKVPIEIMLELPEILDAPVLMPSREYLAAGDSVEHPEFGVGKVVRIATYHDDLGIVLRIEYPDSTHKTLGLNFVKRWLLAKRAPAGALSELHNQGYRTHKSKMAQIPISNNG